MPSWAVSRAGFGAGASPAIVPCFKGSRRISPFSEVAQSYSNWKEDGTTNGQRFIVWRDPSQSFACYGNGDPVTSWIGEQGEAVLPHCGSWPEAAYPGPSAPIFNNPLSARFLDEFFPIGIPFNSLMPMDFEPRSAYTGSGGPELRTFMSWPPMRRVLRHPDPVQRAVGFDYLVNWNRQQHRKRPFYHLGKNGLQAGGPHPFIGVQVGGYEINKNQNDEAGRARLWNWSSSFSFTDGLGNWNGWDKGHHLTIPQGMLAFCGHSLGQVNLWNDQHVYWQNFKPGHDPANGNGFDQPRSAYWQCVLPILGYLAGHEWADPDMIRDFMGGLVNQNSGKGWKPSEQMDWVARRILGQQNGGTYDPPEELIYFSTPKDGGSDDLVLVIVCPDCTTTGTESSPGVHGCKRIDKDCNGDHILEHRNTKSWVDSAGVDWGDQIIGVDMWQSAMALYGLALLLRFHEFIVGMWGPTRGPLLQSTYDSAKLFLTEMAQQIEDRAVNTNGAASFYCGVRSRNPAQREPAGYPKAMADELWLDIDFRKPGKKKEDYVVRQVRNRVDEYVVAQAEHPHGVLFYSLFLTAFARIRGPLDPGVSNWLLNWLPQPGDEDGDREATDYSPHAHYADEVYRLRELAFGIIAAPPRAGVGARASVPNVFNGGSFSAPRAGVGARASVPTVNNGNGSTPRAGVGVGASVPFVDNGEQEFFAPPAGLGFRLSSPTTSNGWNGLIDNKVHARAGVAVAGDSIGYTVRPGIGLRASTPLVENANTGVQPPAARVGMGARSPVTGNGGVVVTNLVHAKAGTAQAGDSIGEFIRPGVGLRASVPTWNPGANANPPRAGAGLRASVPTVDNGSPQIVVGRAGMGMSAYFGDVRNEVPRELLELLEPSGPRRKLVGKIRAVLLNPTRARQRVFVARSAPLQQRRPNSELPAVVLWPEGDDGEFSLEAPREYRRTFRLHALCTVARKHAKAGRSLAGDSIAQGESDDLDQLLEEIEAKLLSEPTLGGLAAGLEYAGTLFDQAPAEAAIASARLAFDVTYYRGNVERQVLAAADFLRAFVDWHVLPEAAGSNILHAVAGRAKAGDPIGTVRPASDPMPGATVSDEIELAAP